MDAQTPDGGGWRQTHWAPVGWAGRPGGRRGDGDGEPGGRGGR